MCFFASGMSGLIYQVVWVRELVLVFGATTFAVSTVLTAFMGGLALGSFICGRRSQLIARPLRLYGLIEVGIGLYGLMVPLIFAILPTVYHPIWQWLHLSFLALSVIRFVFAGLVLVLPTALMGATLPVLASYYAREPNRIGLRVGSLYSLNTFGAVCGAFATGFILIPAFGMNTTTAIAASMNIFLGLVALGYARRHETAAEPSEQQPEKDAARRAPAERAGLIARLYALINPREQSVELPEKTGPASKKPARAQARAAISDAEQLDRTGIAVVLICFALSGFIALSYEVIWSRVLALIIGSSVYAFSIMLTTFLVGLALGASFASRIVDRIRRPVLAFALVEIGVGVTSMAGAYLFNELPYIFMQLYRMFDTSAFGLLLFTRFLVASLVMVVPTLLLGALFPLVVKIMTFGSRDQTTGRMVGDAYSVNTVGAIAGSFASGFIMIPLMGLLGSLRLSAALNFVIAAALFYVSRPLKSKGARKQGRSFLAASRAGIALSALLIIGVAVFEPPWESDVMSSAVYRYAPSMNAMSRQQFAEFLKRGQGETIYYKEGITATIAVQQQSGGRVLKANGKPEASTTGDMPTQILIGSLPLMVREQTDKVLVIGLGSGITLGSVQQFPVKEITCVELEPAMIEASRFFEEFNNRPLEDSRLKMVANDGRNFIYTTEEKFDVIISEPSNPWLTGVANLFTLEYFRRGAERLTDDGVFSQWLQIYEMSPGDVRTLVATFRAAFPHVYLFRGAEGDLMLLGSKSERPLDLSVIKSHFDNPRVAADHKRINTTSAADLLSRLYLGPQEVTKLAAGSPLNTDDNALIEFSAPRRVGTSDETVQQNVRQLLSHAGSPLAYLANAPGLASSRADLMIAMALGAIKRSDRNRGEQFVGYSLDIVETAQAHSMRGELLLARGEEAMAEESWKHALALSPNHFYTLVNLGKLYLTRQNAGRAAPYLDRAIEVDPRSARAHHLRGLAYQAAGDHLRAALEYRKALPDAQYVRSIQTFYLNFGTALSMSGYYEEAAQMLEEYIKLAPNDFDGHFHLGAVLQILSERTLDDALTRRAIEELKLALSIRSNDRQAHFYLSKAYRRLGEYDKAEAEFELYERLSP
ncbi:MAG TPA: fused MFS/spermidine synthase [Blastocatellia bacterium]|nr:fused MFS/spermidine synthase [Blastocatellia bacterium]